MCLQAKSKIYTDRLIKWMLEAMYKGNFGDKLRSAAGARGCAKQIEYVKMYGSANPQAIFELEDKKRRLALMAEMEAGIGGIIDSDSGSESSEQLESEKEKEL